jgi:hypothetical protein
MILKYVVVAAFILHGLAHLSGFVAAFTPAPKLARSSIS